MKPVQVRYKRHRTIAPPDPENEERSVSEEHVLDDALQETFPASDPVSVTMPHGVRRSRGDPGKTRH
jgi:hypothetical protein